MSTLEQPRKRVKSLFLLIAFGLATASCSRGETFFGPTSATNHFLISTNEALLIDGIIGDPGYGDGTFAAQFVVSNTAYAVFLGGSTFHGVRVPYGLPGPGELVVTNTVSISALRVRNTSMKTVLWAQNDTNLFTIPVPSGKTLQFLKTFEQYGYAAEASVWVQLTAGTQSFGGNMFVGEALRGPVTVQIDPGSNSVHGPVALVSYWFEEDVFQNPSIALSVGVGTPRVVVEKSGDMENWQAVATFGAGLGSNAFYRLKIGE